MAKLTVTTLTVANPDPNPHPNPEPNPEQVLAAVARALANLTFDLAMSCRAVHDGALPHLVTSYMCSGVRVRGPAAPGALMCMCTHAYTHAHAPGAHICMYTHAYAHAHAHAHA